MSNTWANYNGEIKGVRVEKDDKKNNTEVHIPEDKLADPTSATPPYYAPAEKEFISAMQGIANRFGKLSDNDDNGIYVGYTSQKDNEVFKIGVYCAHCAHYESKNVCKIIEAKIEPGGKCRLAAIPSELVTVRKTVRKKP